MCSCISFPQTPWYHTMHYLVIPRHTQSMVAYKHGPLGVISMSTIKADLWYMDGYKIKHSCVVCWTWIAPEGAMSGSLSSYRSQDTYETCKTEGLILWTMEYNGMQSLLVWIYVWGVCDNVWGNNSSSLCYTHLWAYTIHPLLLYVGTTPLVKGTAQLYFGL